MIPLSLAEVAEITGATPHADSAGLDMGAVVTGPVVIDSRQARPGSLFAALPGKRADGRSAEQLRPVSIEPRFLTSTPASCTPSSASPSP